jgi:OOP family OmpA-OmpF porin
MIRALCVVAVCAFAFPSMAQEAKEEKDKNLFYVEYGGGVTFTPNQRLIGDDASGNNLSGRSEQDVGFNVNGALGKRFYDYFRAELQFSYRENEVSNISAQNERDNAQGSLGLLAVMVNGYADYDLGVGVIPYVGAGIGWGYVELDAKNTNSVLKMEGEDSVFVWSLMIGGFYPVNEAIDISLGYRYIATTKPDLNGQTKNLGPRRFEGEYDAHELMMGLRFNF